MTEDELVDIVNRNGEWDYTPPNGKDEGTWRKKCAGDMGVLLTEVRRLREALQEISIGRGPYSRDPLTHADNTIDAMKAVALGALDGTWKADSD